MDYKLFLVALVVVASGCMDATGSEDSSPNQTSTPTELPEDTGNTVYLTESGFTPSNIDIEQGEAVTWINNGSREMWVGSDRHPTHTQYSDTTLNEHCQNGDQNSAAFDQCSTGDRFSFTFDQTGEWTYHNHRNAGQGGTVVVQ